MKQTIKAIIVDDESSQFDTLKRRLKFEGITDVEIVDTAETIADAVSAIKRHQPQLVFLDVDMTSNDESGFDLFNHFDAINFKVVFVTGFPQYALEAFKHNALGYLVKGSDLGQRLVKVINECREQIKYQSFFEKQQMQINEIVDKKIVLNLVDSVTLVVRRESIIRAEADTVYTHFYCENNKSYTILKNLKNFEEQLNSKTFLRIHRSHLINKNHIVSYERRAEINEVVMSDGQRVPIGDEGRELLLAFLKTL